MKVICLMDWIESPICENKERNAIRFGETYTVKKEHYGYSSFGKRYVEAYEFYECGGLYEKGIFIPLSNIEEQKINYEKQKIQYRVMGNRL